MLLAGCTAGCSDKQFMTCTLIGCLDGLLISLYAVAEDAGAAPYEIVVNDVSTTSAGVPVATCTFTPSPGPMALSCTSTRAVEELGSMIEIHGPPLTKLVVVVSRKGMKLAELPFEPVYETKEINGPGCGTCTQARIEVTLPP
jgi:hypothetical protein